MKFFLGALALAFGAHVMLESGASTGATAGVRASKPAAKPAATPQCPKTISMGSSDAASVKKLQQALGKKGHGVAADGRYGTETVMALTVFKTEKNMLEANKKSTSVVNKKVWQELGVC